MEVPEVAEADSSTDATVPSCVAVAPCVSTGSLIAVSDCSDDSASLKGTPPSVGVVWVVTVASCASPTARLIIGSARFALTATAPVPAPRTPAIPALKMRLLFIDTTLETPRPAPGKY